MPRSQYQSRPKKNSAVMTTMIPTITEVIQVSFQLVQVTLRRLGAHLAQELKRRRFACARRARARCRPRPPEAGVRRRIAVWTML